MRATFNDGSAGSFDMLGGDGGIHSWIRHLAFGDEVSLSGFLGYRTGAFT